ncbi:hypothetical protein KHA90_07060 [Flavobacterium psychroterrae]|uniref:Toxin-antitoxin system YwqK family antitoxin n=1 Tax=Flavobacterium psychroterrae TaxID=2133767 RepID=A0ABS5P8Y9_9FLAO|nr:hypothetical protein [Flavobacterium psychroterrae]MBS7230778.1 hypothetical protein [Flavobacterium psychroterrae]
MKILLFLLFNFSFLFAQNKSSTVYKEYYENSSVIKVKGFMSDIGTKEGLWNRYTKNGVLGITGNFENDREIGIWKEFYESGKIMKTANYINGKKALQKYYYESGTLISETNYINGKKEGEVIVYWENGKIKSKENYLHNNQIGKFSIYSKNEILIGEGTYSNDSNEIGIWKYFFADGTIRQEIDYSSEKEKKETTYDSSGKIIDVKYEKRL